MKYSKFNLISRTANNDIILFNTLYGNCFIINDKIEEAITHKDTTSIANCDIYKDFIEKSILISDNIDENKYVEYFRNKTKFDTSTVSSTILLTWGCNLACVYCYEGANQIESKSKKLNLQTAEKYIKFMKNLTINNRAKNLHINLFGGEPLTNINIGIYILESLKKFCIENSVNFYSSIITNGTLLNDNLINRLYDLNCRTYQITLDGTQSIHDQRRIYSTGAGSYNEIIKSIEKLNYNPLNLQLLIRINIDKSNVDNAYLLLEKIGVRGFNFTRSQIDFGIIRSSTSACASYSSNCLVESEIGDILNKLWNKAEEEGFKVNTNISPKWIFCGLYSESQYTISPEGDIYKCWEHVGDLKHKIGELDEEGNLINLTYSYYDWMSHNLLDINECKDCIYMPVCGGGCGVISYNNTKTYHSPGCFKVKGVIEKQIERYVSGIVELK